CSVGVERPLAVIVAVDGEFGDAPVDASECATLDRGHGPGFSFAEVPADSRGVDDLALVVNAVFVLVSGDVDTDAVVRGGHRPQQVAAGIVHLAQHPLAPGMVTHGEAVDSNPFAVENE